jgi:hypothetical protein
LIAHQGINAAWSACPTQVQIRNWEASAPLQMPILGLFYDVTHEGALAGAQKINVTTSGHRRLVAHITFGSRLGTRIKYLASINKISCMSVIKWLLSSMRDT